MSFMRPLLMLRVVLLRSLRQGHVRDEREGLRTMRRWQNVARDSR